MVELNGQYLSGSLGMSIMLSFVINSGNDDPCNYYIMIVV